MYKRQDDDGEDHGDQYVAVFARFRYNNGDEHAIEGDAQRRGDDLRHDVSQDCSEAVSYTHLDVYKRQAKYLSRID